MKKNLQKFGNILYDLRLKKGLTLREMCRKVAYDPSNWSKIERGKLPPPNDRKTLELWAKVIGLKRESKEFQEFIYLASTSQGIIPAEILSEKELVAILPAFFRTLKNKHLTKKDLDKIIKLISKA